MANDERVPSSGPDRLRVGPNCAIRIDEIEWRFATSGGPGGQHANRAATRAEATFDIARSPSLDEAQRRRLVDRLGASVTVVVDDTRSQHRNRMLALDRLRRRLDEALAPVRTRRPTKPSRAATERRLEHKRRRSDVKRERNRPRPDD